MTGRAQDKADLEAWARAKNDNDRLRQPEGGIILEDLHAEPVLFCSRC